VTDRDLRDALEARGIPAGYGRLQADAVGEIELDGKVLVVRRIHLTYHLVVGQAVGADQKKRAAIERVLGLHADRCPVARTIGGCVAISTSLDLQTVEAGS
jgi:uncharacterized OsmC-like protein